MSGLVGCFSISMRDIASSPPLPLRCPFSARCWFSSTLVENLLANFRAFGDKRNRSDFDRVGGFGSMIGCARASDVILWMTRTPNRTIDRRVKRSSPWSAILNEIDVYSLNNTVCLGFIFLLWHANILFYSTYPNAHEYHSSCQSELHSNALLEPIAHSVVLNLPLPMKMDMQSFRAVQPMLAVISGKIKINFQLNLHQMFN